MLALQRSALQGAARLVAFEVIARGCASPTRPVFFEALPSLAERVGLSLRKVRQLVRQLEACGLLVRDTEGPPHGGAFGMATRYRVCVEALEAQQPQRQAEPAPAPDALPEALVRRALPPPPVVPALVTRRMVGSAAFDALRERAQPPAPPSQPRGLEPVPAYGRGLAVSNARLAAAGIASDASPFESACAAIMRATRSQYRGNLEALVRALGVEVAHDLARAIEARPARHPAALLVAAVKRDHPDAWARYRTGARRYGTRADRIRQREPMPELPPLELPHLRPIREPERNAP